jgi:glycosyltransferase involved in cell wall biosynthesis
MMARILLSAYACEPDRGSEPGVGWGWATELARVGHQVTVLTRAANRAAIDSKAAPKNLRFVFFDLPRWTQRMRQLPGGKALYYVLWQWLAARVVRRRFPSLPFDLVQHVTYVSVRFPSFMGSLGIPFYFGPVSGGEAVPPTLRAGFPAGARCKEGLRDLSNRLVALDPLMRRTFRQASRILVTRDTLPLLPHGIGSKVVQALAVGLPGRGPEPRETRRKISQLRALYAGRLLHWKGVDIALHAVALARDAGCDIHFTVVGDGPARERLVKLCGKLRLEGTVRWMGRVPQSQVGEFYRDADVLLFPSLRDSGGMVVLEALSHGLPVITTNLGGPGAIANQSCGWMVMTEGRSPEAVARSVADALVELGSSPELLESLSRGAVKRAQQFTFAALVRSVHPGVTKRSMVQWA